MIKVLNLYAGIGGNRKLWTDCEVTAVEIDPEIAKIYQDFFPDDTVIVGDAHQYLLDHYKEFDFIWSSPPCPTHSRARFWGSFGGKYELVYPDMKLYQEILFLKHYAKNKWLVENVKPYYDVLIPAKEIARHLFWSNFYIPGNIKQDRPDVISISKDPTKGRVSDFDCFCNEHEMTRTEYFERLAEHHLTKRGRIITKTEVINNWENIDDMPVMPETKTEKWIRVA